MQPTIERDDSRSMKCAKWIAILLVAAAFLNVWAGCITPPQNANAWTGETAHVEVEASYGIFGAHARYKNYRDTEGKLTAEYNKDTKQFKIDCEFKDTASTATKAQEGLMAEWSKQQQQQIDGLKWVVEQHKIIGENIQKVVGALGDIVTTLTNVLNFKLNKDGVQGGNALAPAAATPAADPKFDAFMQEQQRLNQSILEALQEIQEQQQGKTNSGGGAATETPAAQSAADAKCEPETTLRVAANQVPPP